MDGATMDSSTSFAPFDPSSDNRARSSPVLEAPSRPSGGSWSFRSNSFPKTSFSSDLPTSSVKSGPSAWARNFQSWASTSRDSQSPGSGSKSGFNLFNNIGFYKQTSVKIPVVEVPLESTSVPGSPSQETGPFNTLKTGFLNTSRNAVKAVQTKARHMVSQNKRRYQEGGFDLDLSYITENIIAMGFPAGDMSSGFFGYVEGFYRNHMEEVIKFFETQHKGKYKVYNLCSERLYDAALFEGKVASFPFDDHNCPQLQMIAAFCQSAYSWLKGDLENVVVIHCKAGMARTGLMISCLLLYLKFFPTCEESISFYNQKRCIDGKGVVLPSQLRYVKYFERVLREFDGETPKSRKCILRGIRLHRCPYWIRPAITIVDHNGVLFSSKKHPRTKDMMSEDIWFAAPRKGVMVFALPGERCIADLDGDFKVLFTDRHGDFYCWLNTNMMESRQLLLTSDLDGFDKRRLPSPGFQVEVVVLDNSTPLPMKSRDEQRSVQVTSNTQSVPIGRMEENVVPCLPVSNAGLTQSNGEDGGRDSIFSDSDGDDDENISGGLPNDASIQRVTGEKVVAIPGGEGPGVVNANPANACAVSTTLGDGLGNAMDRMKTAPQAEPIMGSNGSPYDSAKAKAESMNERASPRSSSVGAQEGISAVSLGEEARVLKGEEQSCPRPDPVNLAKQVTDTIGKSHIESDEKGSCSGATKGASKKEKAGRMDSSVTSSDFQAIAADASVFTFGDDEDFESDDD